MALDIGPDQKRFQDKIKDRRKEGLEKYFSREIASVPQPTGKTLRVPIDRLDLPRFTFSGEEEMGGVGQGDGEEGDWFYPDGDAYNGSSHGSGEGDHSFAELSLEEAAEYLEERLELPNLIEKFSGNIGITARRRYKDVQISGPRSLRNFKRTFKQALKRTVASGNYDSNHPVIIPCREDERYKAPRQEIKPVTKAVIVWMLDYSGSMIGVIDFLQNVGFWTDAWIRKHYQDVVYRHIVYDSKAQEVARDDFYSFEAGGGTNMGTGLNLAKKIIQDEYPESDYNAYLVHFTDGDAEGVQVTEEQIEFYKEMAKEDPGMLEGLEIPPVGDPLTDFLIPRCSAIFVCEAGAPKRYHYYWKGRFNSGNYSNLLERIVRTDPKLEQKIRCVSFDDEEIEAGQGEKIQETLEWWFK
ncbi:DUF444 family protein [Candidatus Woesearchaeota archaeon]|nr:DUF444 family protein [Candidatus Woesearchaeota archaeon]